MSVVVKLDYDALAAYTGDIEGLAATSPSVTGERLDPDAPAAQAYETYVEGVEGDFVAALDASIPAADVGDPMRIVYGGVTATVPGDQIDTLATLPGVAAVQRNDIRQLTTDSSPEFVGAPPVYTQLGGAASAGAGVIVGVLDSGSWPEHPSYADPGNLPAPRPKPDGTPRTCDFGDNPLTPATDVFALQQQADRRAAVPRHLQRRRGRRGLPGQRPRLQRPRHPHVHDRRRRRRRRRQPARHLPGPDQRHRLGGLDRRLQGVRCRGLLLVRQSCEAVAQAILDDVDVLNFSISGGTLPFADPVELAFLDAYAAGVFVATSAGNDGPGAGTVNHLGPWVSSVAASTQERAFTSTVTLNGTAGATASLTGATVTAGIGSPLPVVLASAPPYNNVGCLVPAPAGLFAGKIVVCERGPGRVLRGFNVFQGGAAGMLLVNPSSSRP